MARKCPICGGKVWMVGWEENEDVRYIDQFDDEEFRLSMSKARGLYNPVFRCAGCEYEFVGKLDDDAED